MCNAIRALAMDAVQKANSGHPGMPMGMAEIALALWDRHYKHNPADPHWADRDRFVLSNGHGSMLQYALLHLSGYDLPIEEIVNFRQMHSRTPGHPEVGVTPGVETTTGPLGQGFANAVGMALAEKLLAAQFNRPDASVVDHHTYVFVGDGCLMEGISHEAASLAGVWKLDKLIALYDDNGISIDGEVRHWFADDTAQRFRAYGWNVIGPVDGHDVAAVDAAIGAAKRSRGGPSLIICRTVIGKGSPNRAGSAKVHGEALGAAEIAATRAHIGWNHPPFVVPPEVYAAWDARPRGARLQAEWTRRLAHYQARHPHEAAEFKRRMQGELPAGFAAAVQAAVQAAADKRETVATRKASQLALEVLAEAVPEMIGGSADLTGSNLTQWSKAASLRSGSSDGSGYEPGRHINYGVREFGMSAIANGLALHGGFLPFVGTFLTFADYKGAYVFSEAPGGAAQARAVIIATGSEVPLAVQAQQQLAGQGVAVRVVSMPSTTVFDRQSVQYKAAVLPEGVPRVAVEAGVTDLWWKYVRGTGAVLGVDRYGESAPAAAVYRHFGLTAENLAAVVTQVIGR